MPDNIPASWYVLGFIAVVGVLVLIKVAYG
jgi:hypothetical protein